ncbi:hypothetical protein HELRODRAFT_123455, partial [Helobdella robusta]|uniref:GP-PDE domain-containing protein n=1 Tax=Helobdella robusta TaxID=6412 RepID=T1EGX9_HELRO
REAVRNLLPVDRPFIIANRCGNADAPENTIGAVREAISRGSNAVHFDVEFTVDDVAVVFHDKTLERCTNGTGKLCDVTFKFLEMLNASLSHKLVSMTFPNEKIPSLDAMVTECLRHKLIMVIEFKNSALKGSLLLFIHSFIHSFVCPFIPSFTLPTNQMRRSIPMAICGLIQRTNQLSRNFDGHIVTRAFYLDYLCYVTCDWLIEWAYVTWAWFLCGYSFVLLYRKDVSVCLIDYYRNLGITSIVWTVNTKTEKEYF